MREAISTLFSLMTITMFGALAETIFVQKSKILPVDSGYPHALFLHQDGSVFSSGINNEHGELGRTISTNSADRQPSRIPTLPKITSVSASFAKHSLFLDAEYHVWSCGCNNKGQLGSGTSEFSVEPAKVQLLPMISSITAGSRHSVFLADDGTPWGCGNNNLGELGLADSLNRSTAEKIENLPAIKEIYAGSMNSMFLAEDGSVWATGYNSEGELASAERQRVLKLARIEGLPKIKTIALGWSHSLFLDFSGGVWACGSNARAQLGLPCSTRQTTPTKVEIPEMQSIAAGAYHSLFIDDENFLWACGCNKAKQLGLDTFGEEATGPQLVENIPKVKVNNFTPITVKSARKVV